MADTDNGAIVEDDEAQLELQLALERYKCKYLTPYNVVVQFQRGIQQTADENRPREQLEDVILI